MKIVHESSCVGVRVCVCVCVCGCVGDARTYIYVFSDHFYIKYIFFSDFFSFSFRLERCLITGKLFKSRCIIIIIIIIIVIIIIIIIIIYVRPISGQAVGVFLWVLRCAPPLSGLQTKN